MPAHFSHTREGLLKHRLLRATPKCPILGLGWGLAIHMSDMVPGDADAVGLGDHTLRTRHSLRYATQPGPVA